MKTKNTEEPKVLIPYARVSSAPQATEDKTGLERQFLSARRTLASHPNWQLDENFSLVDVGSGYKGKNLEPEAALGGFLKAVKEGKVSLTPTKILHIDEMSRLSRLPLRKARALFEGILEAGVEIYIAQDSKLYTKQSLDDPMDLIMTLLRQEAATNLSKELGSKISRAWKIKKQRLAENGKAYRSKPPGWLKWNETTNAYEPITEKVKSIRRLFELANMGHGVRNITKHLNQEGATRIGNYKGEKVKSVRWSNVVVNTILTGKKVLGYNDNVDPPVRMYPEVIGEKVYYSARAKMEERKTHKYYGQNGGGRNLFAGVVKCKECDQRLCMHHIPSYPRKGVVAKNYGTRGGVGARGGKAVHTYLWCGGYVNGSCSSKQIVYDHLEESFVGVISGSVHVLEIGEKKSVPEVDVEMLKGQLAEANALLSQYTADYTETPTKAGLKLIAAQEETEERLTAQLERATAIDVGSTPLSEAKAELLGLLYKDWTGEEIRLLARQLIRTLVEKVVVDIKQQSYVIHWRGKAKPTKVELVKRGYRLTGYKINGHLYPSIGGDWQKHIATIADRITDAEKSYSPIAS